MQNVNVDGSGRILSGPLYDQQAWQITSPDAGSLEGTERLLTFSDATLPEGKPIEISAIESIYNSALNSAGSWNDPANGNHQWIGRASVRAVVTENALSTQAATAAAKLSRPIGVFRGWTCIKNSSTGGSVQVIYFPMGFITRAKQGGILLKHPENPAWGVWSTAFVFGRHVA